MLLFSKRCSCLKVALALIRAAAPRQGLSQAGAAIEKVARKRGSAGDLTFGGLAANAAVKF